MATRKKKDAKAPKGKRLNLRLDVEAHERLMLHCLKRGMKPGALLSELVDQHLREWNIHAYATRAGDTIRLSEEAA